MNANNGTLRTMTVRCAVSRRAALRGMGGAALAAMAIGLPGRAGADPGHRSAASLFAQASGDDPAVVIEAYVAAVNAGDLDAILDLYDDDAFHIVLPSPDGSAGVCQGKEQFRMWYEQSVANGDHVELADGTLAVAGNQATFVARLSGEPWRKLGVETLEAHSQIVVIDGRIMTHVVLLTPASVRRLQSARGEAVLAPIAGEAWASTQQFPGQPY